MSSVDLGEVIFLVIVVAAGLGGMIWAVRNEKK